MSKGPGRERVGGESRVHERDAALEALVTQIRKEAPQLLGSEHPFVDDRPRRQRREVDADLCVLETLAQDEALALERVAAKGAAPARGPAWTTRDEDLREPRCARLSLHAGSGELDWHITPPEHTEALFTGELTHELHRFFGCARVRRQKGDPCGVTARLGNLESRHLRIEPVRQLN